jgi:hypothetical protein
LFYDPRKKNPLKEKASILNENTGFEIFNPEQQGRYVDKRLFRLSTFILWQQQRDVLLLKMLLRNRS